MTEPIPSPVLPPTSTSSSEPLTTAPTQASTPSPTSNLFKWVIGIGLLLICIGGISFWFRVWSLSQLEIPRVESELLIETPVITQAFQVEPESTQVTPILNYGRAPLEELANAASVTTKDQLTGTQLERLEAEQFLVVKNSDIYYLSDPDSLTDRADDWTKLYQYLGQGSRTQSLLPTPVFITTDLLLHVFHRLVGREMEVLEKTILSQRLLELTNQLYAKTMRLAQDSSDPLEKASYARLSAYFAVPKVILESANTDLTSVTDPGTDKIETMLSELKKLEPEMTKEAFALAGRELNLLVEAKQVVPSPLFGELKAAAGDREPEDYTQYQPRSHYQKHAQLRNYFRAMQWYGRVNFLTASPELSRDALHLTILLRDRSLQNLWHSIHDPISFWVGESTSFSWQDYAPLLLQYKDEQLTTAQITTLLPSVQTLQQPAPELTTLQSKYPPGWQLFGQRLVFDAQVFASLTKGGELPDSPSQQQLPTQTTALWLLPLLGHQAAEAPLQTWIATQAPESDQVLAHTLQYLLAKTQELETSVWQSSLYWQWLHLLAVLAPSPELSQGYPAFMTARLWPLKSMQTALGSFTELKHDTLLYSKQSLVLSGGGGDDQQLTGDISRGYVEPNLGFFDALITTQKAKLAGMAAYQLHTADLRERNQTLLQVAEFLRSLVVKQLQDEEISPEEFSRLQAIGIELEEVVAVLPEETQTEAAARSGVVVDIHTDLQRKEILHQATDKPDYLYVVIKDRHGARLTKGLVYRYYEFTRPLSSRLTDEQWQEKIYQTQQGLPLLPLWAVDLRSD